MSKDTQWAMVSALAVFLCGFNSGGLMVYLFGGNGLWAAVLINVPCMFVSRAIAEDCENRRER